jgi:hypothetical protein
LRTCGGDEKKKKKGKCIQAQQIISYSSTMRVLAPQPPRRRVDNSRRLLLTVEVAQVLFLPIVVDASPPLAALLFPAHAHELHLPRLPRATDTLCSGQSL